MPIDTNEVSAKLSFADAVLALVKEHKLGPKRRVRRSPRKPRAQRAQRVTEVAKAQRKPRASRPRPLPVDASEE